ncbi:RNA ligase family protein [Serratia quinivorans]|uniref:RNA ligase family protein n=1 Tax=Serratia quinivorans TaxID=137545 RepID=UPI003F94A229
MTDFFRFPHTPHLMWLGEGSPRSDKMLSPNKVTTLLSGNVVVEEKLDGANLGFSLASGGSLRVQNRGQYLTEPYLGQFTRLPAWLAQHGASLQSVLKPELILFGEWCAARHSLDYVWLPDWFLLFDVYDRAAGRFWSTTRRNALATIAKLATVPEVMHGNISVTALKQLVITVPSRYREGQLEGVVIRRESTKWCEARAKLVRPDFTQAIDMHWRKRTIEWNCIDILQRTQNELL